MYTDMLGLVCVLQVAWYEGRQLNCAVIDPFSVDIGLLAPALAADGPIKVLHDLTFDVRMLQQLGLDVGNVRDTSVAARFLGAPATGLAALVKSRFDVELGKKLQDHDWSERPLHIFWWDSHFVFCVFIAILKFLHRDSYLTQGFFPQSEGHKSP